MSDLRSKKWLAVDIVARAEAVNAAEYALNAMDSLGNEIDTLRKSESENVTITGYFHELPDAEWLREEINAGLRIYDLPPTAIFSIDTRDVRDADWLAEWKRHWKPTEIGKFIIAPPWSDVADTDKIVIRIEPNMAFGTGTHETTQLCLQAIGEDYRAGETFLDVGTGTGILAIAAAKCKVQGSRFKVEDSDKPLNLERGTWNCFLACDTDADSVKIAIENAGLNDVGDFIDFSLGPIDDDTPTFDFVCANLTIDVILPILPLLMAKAKRKLILSGILAEQQSMIADALTRLKISDFSVTNSGEWIAVSINFSNS